MTKNPWSTAMLVRSLVVFADVFKVHGCVRSVVVYICPPSPTAIKVEFPNARPFSPVTPGATTCHPFQFTPSALVATSPVAPSATNDPLKITALKFAGGVNGWTVVPGDKLGKFLEGNQAMGGVVAGPNHSVTPTGSVCP